MLSRLRVMFALILTAASITGCAITGDATGQDDVLPAVDIDGETYFIASLDEIDDLPSVQPQAQGAWRGKAGRWSWISQPG